MTRAVLLALAAIACVPFAEAAPACPLTGVCVDGDMDPAGPSWLIVTGSFDALDLPRDPVTSCELREAHVVASGNADGTVVWGGAGATTVQRCGHPEIGIDDVECYRYWFVFYRQDATAPTPSGVNVVPGYGYCVEPSPSP